MPVPRNATHADSLAAHDWRAVLVGMLPILSGAAVPWLVWESIGRLGSGELAAAALISTAAYLRIIWQLGEQENAARKRLGRRYVPPAPDVALAVCGGLVVSLMAPGISAYALVDAVGFPRLAGVVQSYEPAALAETGATLDVIGVAPAGPVVLVPGGNAQVLDSRTGAVLPFPLSWRADAARLCIVQDAILPDSCLALDPASGKLRDGERGVVGRVTAVGSGPRLTSTAPVVSDLIR
jgi:hypothetical protein